MKKRSLTQQEKMTAAAKQLGLWLGLALIVVFIPILHFVLVPVFLIVALWMAARELKKTHFISDYFVSCEKCQTKVEFCGPIDSNLLRKNCPNCKTQVCVDLGSLA